MSDDELRRIREAVEAIRNSDGVRYSGAGATRALQQIIQSFNEVATRQTDTLIGLTRWIARLTVVLVALTGVLVAGLIVQIGLMLRAAPASPLAVAPPTQSLSLCSYHCRY
jgi:urea transporter